MINEEKLIPKMEKIINWWIVGWNLRKLGTFPTTPKLPPLHESNEPISELRTKHYGILIEY